MHDDQVVWVKFKYENLAMFCFYCEKVGHAERNCSNKKNYALTGDILDGQ